MTIPLHFVVGLRSGSTLLQNLLAQNPAFHVTATNDLIELVVAARDSWMTYDGFKAQGLSSVEPRIVNMLGGMIHGFYRAEIDSGKTIFDKSRGWPAYIELLETILARPVKIIVCIRDLRDIVASFEKLFRKSIMTKHAPHRQALFDVQTVDGRARQLLSKEAVGGLYVNRILDAFDRGVGDRLVIVPYRELTEFPQQTLARLHMELGLMPFTYNHDYVEQKINEDDQGYGMNLHTIRPKVEPETQPAWHGVLPERTAQWIEEEYSDMIELSRRSYLTDFRIFFGAATT